MDDLSPIIALLGAKYAAVAAYWLAAEKLLKVLQPFIRGRVDAAIARVVETDDDPEDEAMLRRLLSSRAWRIAAFALDFLIRFKLPAVSDLDAAIKKKAQT